MERTVRSGKRVFASAFKAWMVEQAGLPGVSVAGLAMRHGVNANQLRRWVKLAAARGAPALPVVVPAVLPVTIDSGVEPAAPVRPAECEGGGGGVVIVIELGGAVVRVGSGVCAADVRAVIEALRA